MENKIEKPICKNCNQMVFDENGIATGNCIIKGKIDNIDKMWCSYYNVHFIVPPEKKKKYD